MTLQEFDKAAEDFNTDIEISMNGKYVLLFADSGNVNVTADDICRHLKTWSEIENMPIIHGMPFTDAYKIMTFVP